jgi:hypothetical protein
LQDQGLDELVQGFDRLHMLFICRDLYKCMVKFLKKDLNEVGIADWYRTNLSRNYISEFTFFRLENVFSSISEIVHSVHRSKITIAAFDR